MTNGKHNEVAINGQGEAAIMREKLVASVSTINNDIRMLNDSVKIEYGKAIAQYAALLRTNDTSLLQINNCINELSKHIEGQVNLLRYMIICLAFLILGSLVGGYLCFQLNWQVAMIRAVFSGLTGNSPLNQHVSLQEGVDVAATAFLGLDFAEKVFLGVCGILMLCLLIYVYYALLIKKTKHYYEIS